MTDVSGLKVPHSVAQLSALSGSKFRTSGLFRMQYSFIRITFYLYLSALLFGATFKIKQFEYIVPTISTIIVFAGLIPESVTYSVDQLREGFLRTITPFILVLPVILWITAKLKGEFKNGKT